ncbi:WecB/TagA/CpsF family glycosyltransferase [Lactobacillus curvatus]|nr:WecB/TagA/CpsF family glycosyltransferase [Latilactobacillus curvatus]MSE24065.1 WecB/TagA/CpsF family glycosyltransferase [Latilactobacillus curvatus]
MSESLEIIEDIIKAGKPTQHVVLNANKVNILKNDLQLRKIINSCPLVNADGQSIVWAGRLLGYDVPERVTGIDLFTALVSKSAEKGYKVFYFGGEEQVVKEVIKLHQAQYPALKVVGYRNGFFDDSESERIAEEIQKSGADILFVAFPSPKKEYWINQYQEIMKVPFAMGVGGSFDVIAGKTKRAPKWLQKIGLEWFYRFVQEPKRMFRRYIIGNITFLKFVIHEKVVH